MRSTFPGIEYYLNPVETITLYYGKGDETVNYERAKAIINSTESIEVTYNGTPVWIQDLNPDGQTALVSTGDFGEGLKTVSVEQLTETGRSC